MTSIHLFIYYFFIHSFSSTHTIYTLFTLCCRGLFCVCARGCDPGCLPFNPVRPKEAIVCFVHTRFEIDCTVRAKGRGSRVKNGGRRGYFNALLGERVKKEYNEVYHFVEQFVITEKIADLKENNWYGESVGSKGMVSVRLSFIPFCCFYFGLYIS